jgi:hypothetical protein
VLHKYHNVAEMCQITKLPQLFENKNAEKKSKNPHKIDFFPIFHIFKIKMWSLKPLVYKAKVPFSPFPRFSKTFWKNFS